MYIDQNVCDFLPIMNKWARRVSVKHYRHASMNLLSEWRAHDYVEEEREREQSDSFISFHILLLSLLQFISIDRHPRCNKISKVIKRKFSYFSFVFISLVNFVLIEIHLRRLLLPIESQDQFEFFIEFTSTPKRIIIQPASSTPIEKSVLIRPRRTLKRSTIFFRQLKRTFL